MAWSRFPGLCGFVNMLVSGWYDKIAGRCLVGDITVM